MANPKKEQRNQLTKITINAGWSIRKSITPDKRLIVL